MRSVILLLIRSYRLILSPVLPPRCRFTPTCSEYALLTVERYGVFRGMYLGAARILKCHPFHPGGHDPVPGTESFDYRCTTHD
ncbi:MAG TPA: membrane protein insertion efficiency factor YidD [Gammaproteobacteria bacterium]